MSWQTKLTRWAKQLKQIGTDGIAHASTIYEVDNHRTFLRLTNEMDQLAADTNRPFSPSAQKVSETLSPFAVADAAVIDAEGRMLLIRRADNGLWAFPGGALEVNETIATGAVREAYEETGVRSEAVAFVGVWDSRLYKDFHSRFHMYQFVILCRPLTGAAISENPSHAEEIKEIRWFTENQLPSLDEIDPGHRPRIPFAFCGLAWRKTAVF